MSASMLMPSAEPQPAGGEKAADEQGVEAGGAAHLEVERLPFREQDASANA
jgi:hypothetical protein